MKDSAEGARARAVAAIALHAVIEDGRNLDDGFAEAELSELPARDRSFAKALAFGTLRLHLRNAAILSRLLDKPLRRKDAVVTMLMSVALFELTETDAPDYAVVSAAVDATRSVRRPALRKLVNAILRRFQRERDELLNAVGAADEARHGYPAWLLDRLRSDWPDDWEAIAVAGNQQAPLWLRVNTCRTDRDAYREQLEAAGMTVTHAPATMPAAVCLEQAVSVSDLPGFAAGDCSVQDAASQLAAEILDAQPGMRVLDACAAPGGKTTHMLERAENDLQLVALDSSERRLERVRENLQRLQLNADVICGDALNPGVWADGRRFDRILVDAPCSATGVIRRHPDIRFLRRDDDIPSLHDVQLSMLNALWPLLQPGGRLLYVTCSLLATENESVTAEFLNAQPTASHVDITPLLPGTAVHRAYGAQLLPGSGATDGFYYALMERSAD
ncbi:MAG: 16S rRNA (cytosine(967)-C(5))-methyltransferase RsmB [Gammaproteobacteria bacterium]|nr:16S rRNA (cytosine(967)-C(5))-methyltransferase RsmB [Gammaproteobacteria bacterium]